MIRIDTQRTQFYLENTDEENKRYFGLTYKKFLHNVDTLYYSIFIQGDSKSNEIVGELLNDLELLKDKVKEDRENKEFSNGLLMALKRHDIYGFCLSCPDKYDIFITDFLPNDETPRIAIQLRSFYLWMDGVYEALEDSLKTVKEVLALYGLSVKMTRENRIDYSFHTNIIQDPYHFFSDKKLEQNMKTTLEHYRKEGNITKHGITLDYLALGMRASNNIFFRCYNKTKEVIEKGYKEFFFKTWYEEGLINFYDKWCYEFAFNKSSYFALDEARLQFYITFGHDQKHKREIQLTLADKNTTYDHIKALADLLMPKTTIILNLEFQTKRKFYYYADNQINQLPTNNRTIIELDRLYKILDNRKIFLDYLTENTITFIDKNGKTQDWWKRLQGLKIETILKEKMDRKYNNQLDKEKIQKKLINAIATHALYNNKKDTNFIEDFTDLLSVLNDNDLNGKHLNIISLATGELLQDINSAMLDKYNQYKEKKYKTIKNRLPDSTDNTTKN